MIITVVFYYTSMVAPTLNLNTYFMIDVEIRLTPRAKMVSGKSRLPLTLLLKHRSNLHTCQLAKRNKVVLNNTYYKLA